MSKSKPVTATADATTASTTSADADATTDAAQADAAAAAPVATGKLTHQPCGTVTEPGEEGIAFAKRTGTYFCGRCGGTQAARTFVWADGAKLVE